MTNPLRNLRALGQSVWLDYLARRILDDGALQRLIDEDGLAGMTSNPSIFEKAIGETGDYDDRIAAALTAGVTQPMDLYERLAVDDIQDAAHIFRPTWDRLAGADGYVSLEVSP
ncbi:MAG TPA: transaldolase family protein, partial [Solirubrobacterales bacterium]